MVSVVGRYKSMLVKTGGDLVKIIAKVMRRHQVEEVVWSL